jgi:CRISPR-associated protein Cmr4
MFDAGQVVYFYVETPLHAGSGSGVGPIDLPIQRERVTGYPIVQASSIKGRLRAEAKVRGMSDPVAWLIFGPDAEHASEHAGALSSSDARLLLFPVRSLAGVFAWVTSVELLARFRRDVAALTDGWNGWQLPPEINGNQALVAPNSVLTVADQQIVLEELSFTTKSDPVVSTVGQWLASSALPADPVYDAYWREALPLRLVILPDEALRDFTQFATEIVTRVQLNTDTKTVAGTGLWTEENLPVETLLYAPFFATPPRGKPKEANGQVKIDTGQDVLSTLQQYLPPRLCLGGDETVGRGSVALRFGEVRGLNGR